MVLDIAHMPAGTDDARSRCETAFLMTVWLQIRGARSTRSAATCIVSKTISIVSRKQNVEAKDRDAKRKPAGSKKADLMVRRSTLVLFSHSSLCGDSAR